MDYSEFLRRLGADPKDQDPEFLGARESDQEFRQAASEAESFERKLERAVRVPVPGDLMEQLLNISQDNAPATRFGRWRQLAIAAGLLMAVGAAGITWNLNQGWDSVDEYVMDHYRHDGEALLREDGAVSVEQVQEVFARFGVTTEPALSDAVSLIKYCPTPDGKGVHMVLSTDEGPVTVIYMPETDVEDHQSIGFDGVNALYVSLEKGSAIIIGRQQGSESLYSMVQRSIIPTVNKA